MMSKHTPRIFVLAFICVLISSGYTFYRRQQGRQNALEFAQFGLWRQARQELSGYLRIHPSDAQARFFMAELWVNDSELSTDDAVPAALAHLRRIPNDSSLAAAARTHEAKLTFLVLHQPAAAERLLRKAIRLDRNALEAYQLLSKVLEMTERHHLCEPIFWRIYDLTPENERVLRLRDWYMSQFFPLTTNAELDRNMGFSQADETSLPAEAIRYIRFRDTEPDELLGRTALARWTMRKGKPHEALSLLDVEGSFGDNRHSTNVFFLGTLIDALLELGEYRQASHFYQQWPESGQAYDYWRITAIVHEEVKQEYDDALLAYDRALKLWPGPNDWRLMHRKAGCLARAGKRAESVAMRKKAEYVEQLMANKVHERLRLILGSLENPANLQEVALFYKKLGRQREFDAWSNETARRIADTLE